MSAPAPSEHVWWLASRASGIVALALVTLSVGVGLAMAGKTMRKPGLGKALMAVHEHASLAALIAIAVHGVTLLGDPFLRPALVDIAVPFAGDYRPVPTGIGIVGGYLAAALGLSFYFRKRIGPKLWRSAHRATVLVYVMSVIHTLGSGTDASTPWLRGALIATGAPILGMFVIRVLPRAPSEGRAKQDAPAKPKRAPEPAGQLS